MLVSLGPCQKFTILEQHCMPHTDRTNSTTRNTERVACMWSKVLGAELLIKYALRVRGSS